MTPAHAHRHSAPPLSRPDRLWRDGSGAGRWVAGLLAGLAVLVAVGMLLLWPAHHPRQAAPGGLAGALVNGTVQASRAVDCAAGGGGCQTSVTVLVTSGPDAGTTTMLSFTPGPTDPRLRVGDHIRMARAVQSGQVLYQFDDIQRGRPLLLGLMFAGVVLAVGRWRGLAALAGLVFAGAVLVVFLIPALVDGGSPLLVALLAGAAITLVVLPLSHGMSLTTAIAMLGTLGGMAVAAGLAEVSLAALRITGLSSEEYATLTLQGSRSTVGGLLLAGAVIGALGVLNDVTVTQAAAVAELTAGGLRRRNVMTSAMRIGRDHIASTVYSLVLAYAGSALPLLLLFSLSGQSTTEVLTSDSLAPEIAISLIGGIALVLVVPLTTALAATVSHSRQPVPSTGQPAAVTAGQG
jgi:uncharacterized membrane protein